MYKISLVNADMTENAWNEVSINTSYQLKMKIIENHQLTQDHSQQMKLSNS